MTAKRVKTSQNRLYYVKQILFGVFDASLVVLAAVASVAFWLYCSATPAASQLVNRKIAQTSTIYDATGQHVLYEIHGEENRKIISHSEIPNSIRIATIAAEDANFYHHFGIDPLSIIRAFKVNLENDEIMQGGSTITQQLARSAFLTRDRTMQRKIFEAIFALKIERHYTKDEILDQYLNEIPYGANAYGIETASETYFGKKASDLTLDEAAFLAALPKAPSYYSPYNTHHDALTARQKNILQRIGELNLAPQNDMQEALAEDTFAKIKPSQQLIVAPHFVFFVLDQLEQKYGKDFIQTGGLQIYTSLNYDMQKLAENVVTRGAQKNISLGASNAALVAVNPKNGNILAMVGSKNYYDQTNDGQVNVAISPRQPGSSFKPFAYAEAFIKGYQPETMILDAQTDFGPDGSGHDYIPRNYDGKFHGLLPMRSTLAMSLNVPAVKVLYLAGIDNTIELAHQMGITTLNERNRYGLSLVLGGGEVKLLDMAGAFSVFATEGLRNPVQSVVKITDSSGKVYEQENISPQRVMDVQIARKINSILSDNTARTPIFGAHSPLILDGKTVAAKTGTTSEFRDAWTVGYTPSIAVGVWAGNNDNRPMRAGSDGVFVAAPIWHDFMQQVLANKPDETFIAYDTYKPNELAANIMEKVTYYNNQNGKKISEHKARKLGSDKVDKQVEYIPADNGSGAQTISTFTMALPNPADPMYKSWLSGTVTK
jgi:1A family penicillin-binding protein